MASSKVNRVRKDLGTLSVAEQRATVSAGLCAYEAGMDSPDELLAKAHEMLAAARGKGGNALMVAGDVERGSEMGYAIL